jgi:hypothetical protein
MNFTQRKAVWTNLRPYCYHAGPDDTVEACEWVNGEGWDISIGDNKMISLTMGELHAIQVLCSVAHPKEV